MAIDHREIAFEDAIEHHLLNVAGFAKGDSVDFDRERALDPTVFIPFVQETQPETWESLEKLHGSETESVVLDDLREQRSPLISAAITGKIDVR